MLRTNTSKVCARRCVPPCTGGSAGGAAVRLVGHGLSLRLRLRGLPQAPQGVSPHDRGSVPHKVPAGRAGPRTPCGGYAAGVADPSPRSPPARRRTRRRPVGGPVGLDHPAPHVERAGPHLVEELPQPGEPLGSGPVQPPGAVTAFDDQAGVLEHGEVLADRGPGHVERRRDLPGRQLVGGRPGSGWPAGGARPAPAAPRPPAPRRRRAVTPTGRPGCRPGRRTPRCDRNRSAGPSAVPASCRRARSRASSTRRGRRPARTS